MLTGYKFVALEALIEASYREDQEFTADTLLKVCGPDVTTYDLVDLLCHYIGGIRKVKRRKDLQALCELRMANSELHEALAALHDKYRQSYEERLEVYGREQALRLKCDEQELKIRSLSSRVEVLDRQLQACRLKAPIQTE